MIAKQITLPAENRPGVLARVTGIFSKEKINIRSITISSFGDHGFFSILVDAPEAALAALNKDGLDARLTDVIAVLMDDRPGGLHHIVKILADEGVNIENAYGFVLESFKNAVFVIEVKEPEKTVEILARHGVQTLDEAALCAVEPFHYMKY